MTRLFPSILIKWHHHNHLLCSGGNQRELAREKAAKKAAANSKGPKQSGASLAKRKEECVLCLYYLCIVLTPCLWGVKSQGRREAESEASGEQQLSSLPSKLR